MTPAGAPLFDVDVPSGFHYRAEFISAGEEAALAVEIGRLEFSTFEMRAVVARRRVAFFGRSYDPGETPTAPLPAFLMPLRASVAAWAGVEPDAFAMVLINEYRPDVAEARQRPRAESYSCVSQLSAAAGSITGSGAFGYPPGSRVTSASQLLVSAAAAHSASSKSEQASASARRTTTSSTGATAKT